MKINSIIKIGIVALLLFGLSLILPKPTVITDELIIQSAFQTTTVFFSDKLGYNMPISGNFFVGLYSSLIALSIWAYYHLILFLRLLIIKDWKKIRGFEKEGLSSRLLSLSKYRLINILFGNLYKVLAFVIFTIILYNIPIVNRLIYLYMLEFLDINFFADALIMALLIVILPRVIESFLIQKRTTKAERGLMNVEKIKALVTSANKETANI